MLETKHKVPHTAVTESFKWIKTAKKYIWAIEKLCKIFATIQRLKQEKRSPLFLLLVIASLVRGQGTKTIDTTAGFLLEHNDAYCCDCSSFLNNSCCLICILLSSDVSKELNAETVGCLSSVVICD